MTPLTPQIRERLEGYAALFGATRPRGIVGHRLSVNGARDLATDIRALLAALTERDRRIGRLEEGKPVPSSIGVATMPLDQMTDDQHRQCGCSACLRILNQDSETGG